MSIIIKYVITWPEGTTPVSIHEWVNTLSQAEQEEYWASWHNQNALRQVAIGEGRLILQDYGYEWRDAEAQAIGHEEDAVHNSYWKRWKDETGAMVKFK